MMICGLCCSYLITVSIQVRLKNYYNYPPTLSIGWGSQSDKRVISDFEILNVSHYITYYKHGNSSTLEPITANELAVNSAHDRVLQKAQRYVRHQYAAALL
ncbi:hypothetical protein ANCDUO_18187, partial [Ancylostoma duodenale]